MSRSNNAPLYPDEAEIARRVLGKRAREWPGKAVLLERDGLPKIDPLMGGRFWPAVRGGSWIDMALQRNCLAARHCLPKAGFASFHSRQTGRPTSMARKRQPLMVKARPSSWTRPGLSWCRDPAALSTNTGGRRGEHVKAATSRARSS
jgi:hypothetical protein